jgi:Mg2+ and Co2+ transporter CorA
MFYIDIKTNQIEKISLDELRQMRINLDTPGEHVLWVDIENPTEQDMKVVEAKFGLHPLTTEDILNFSTGIIIAAISHLVDAREKTESFENYLFVVTKEMGYFEGSNILHASNINSIVFPGVILTIHPDGVSSISMVSL